ncbi:MAG: hypothetical protein AVDCRST_MAG76-2267, partial [uncultured Acidimicrobiales bacterium]
GHGPLGRPHPHAAGRSASDDPGAADHLPPAVRCLRPVRGALELAAADGDPAAADLRPGRRAGGPGGHRQPGRRPAVAGPARGRVQGLRRPGPQRRQGLRPEGAAGRGLRRHGRHRDPERRGVAARRLAQGHGQGRRHHRLVGARRACAEGPGTLLRQPRL